MRNNYAGVAAARRSRKDTNARHKAVDDCGSKRFAVGNFHTQRSLRRKGLVCCGGKDENPVYGLEEAPKDAPRALEFVFSGRITDEMYKRLTYPTAPWEVKEVPSNTFWGNLVSSVLPFLIIVGVLYFLFTRQMRATGRSAMSFGKSRARLLSPDKDRVTFKDVAGCDESKEEVSEVVEFLKTRSVLATSAQGYRREF